ncbi:GNAT family N-acetyltransferase [Micromonospora sp. NPDC005806]|uniref:GNAT family N-acetyltransferase n=1 Tax=Micromonospora sp. NPDC005806 TaxID=3364234 RepID=UPI00368A34DF
MIRPAVVADRTAVEDLVHAAYAPWIEVTGVQPLPMVADYAELIGAGQVWVFDPVEGLIVLVPEDGVLLIENVAVSPAAQGRGLGRCLLAFAEDQARALGLSTLRLYTNEKMTSNIAFYERLGYVATERENINGRHAVHMRKPLPPA